LPFDYQRAKSIVSSHLHPITDSEITAQGVGTVEEKNAATQRLRKRLDSIMVSTAPQYRTVTEPEQTPRLECGIADALTVALYESTHKWALRAPPRPMSMISSLCLEIYASPLPLMPLYGLTSEIPTDEVLLEESPGDSLFAWWLKDGDSFGTMVQGDRACVGTGQPQQVSFHVLLYGQPLRLVASEKMLWTDNRAGRGVGGKYNG
jgi:hypothetical protein